MLQHRKLFQQPSQNIEFTPSHAHANSTFKCRIISLCGKMQITITAFFWAYAYVKMFANRIKINARLVEMICMTIARQVVLYSVIMFWHVGIACVLKVVTVVKWKRSKTDVNQCPCVQHFGGSLHWQTRIDNSFWSIIHAKRVQIEIWVPRLVFF